MPDLSPESERLDELAGDFAKFVLRPQGTRPPAADVGERDRICQELIEVLPQDRESFIAAVARLVQPAARRVLAHPQLMSQVLGRTARYFRSIHAVEHPLADGNVTVRKRGGKPMRPIDLPAAEAMVTCWMNEADEADLLALAESLDQWEAWRALAAAAGAHGWSPSGIARVILAAGRFAEGDMASFTVINPLVEVAAGQADVARAAIDGWIEGRPGAVELTPSALLVLVSGALRHHPEWVESWKENVVTFLAKSDANEHRWLAAQLATTAWAEGHEPSLEKRLTVLRRHVEANPVQMLPAGLHVLRFSARERPALVLREAVNMAGVAITRDPDNAAAHAVGLAGVAQAAGWGLDKSDDEASDLLFVLDSDRLLPVTAVQARNGLDSFLQELMKDEPEAVRTFVGRWLAAHRFELRGEGVGLQEVLPLVHGHLRKTEHPQRWLVNWAVAADPDLRAVALELLVHESRRSRARPLFTHLSSDEAEAFAHALLGSGLTMGSSVPFLAQMAEELPPLREAVVGMLRDTMIEELPGQVGEVAQRWQQVEDYGAEPSLAACAARLIEAESRRLEGRRLLAALPELGDTQIAKQEATEAFNRQIQMPDSPDAWGRGTLLSLLPRVPVIRGASTRFRVDDGSVDGRTAEQGFGRIEHRFELPARESFDPIASVLSRMHHQQQAEALFARLHGPATDGKVP